MKIIDVQLGHGMEFIVDETAGTLTLELKGTVLGQPEDVKIPISLVQILTAIQAGMTNTYAKWILGLLLTIL